jgi:hypothetical protein
MQADLFAPTGVIVRSPLCVRMKHCGALAVLGEPEDLGGCVNRSITCLRCGATGIESRNTEVHDRP